MHDLPELVDSLIDDRFAAARASLIGIVRKNLDAIRDELKATRKWLDAEFSERAVREALERKSEERRKRDLGQMTPPAGPTRSTKPSKDIEIAGDQLRSDRLEAAIKCLHAENQRGDGLRLLGSNIPRAERIENARRAVVVGACIVDPDSGEYLASVTPLANAPWRGDGDAEPQIRGRHDLLRRWGWNAMELLAEACEVLGWMAMPERTTSPDVDDNPLERDELFKAVEVAQDRWPTLLDALVHLYQRRDILPLKRGDTGYDLGVTESIGAPWAFAMQRVWKLLGLSTPRNGSEIYDYVVACATSTINDSTVNRIVAPAMRELDTPEVRRSLWLALFERFPHIGRELLAKADEDSPKVRKPPEGEWSIPMPKAELMIRLKLKPRAFEIFAKQHGLLKVSRQQWQIRVDTMDSQTRHRIESGRPTR